MKADGKAQRARIVVVGCGCFSIFFCLLGSTRVLLECVMVAGAVGGQNNPAAAAVVYGMLAFWHAVLLNPVC